jgi:hypothetical protein
MSMHLLLTIALSLVVTVSAQAQQSGTRTIPSGAKVYVAPMPDKFDEYLKTAIAAKKVPVAIVSDRSAAQYELTGHSETEKAGTAKKVIMLNWHSNEQASIKVADLASGEVVFAYSVSKKSSAHGKQSTAEACAKHLKRQIESSK